jgi:hypothetical protein
MWRSESYDWIGRTPENVIFVSQKSNKVKTELLVTNGSDTKTNLQQIEIRSYFLLIKKVVKPGMIGQVIPTALQSSTNFLNADALKNNCVMMKSAPASAFSLSIN